MARGVRVCVVPRCSDGTRARAVINNNELLKCCERAWLVVARAGIEDLREKREEVNRQILRQEEEKAKIQKARRARCVRAGDVGV